MFNLKNHQTDTESDLLHLELRMFDICPHKGQYEIAVGDEVIHCKTLDECVEHLISAIDELKKHVWEDWQDLKQLADLIVHNDAGNSGDVDNLLYINNVKRSYLFSNRFHELSDVTASVEQLFDIDAADIHQSLIKRFNKKFLIIKMLHHLIMNDIYRVNLIHQYKRLTKRAQISGMWANLDLPMRERVWPYEEDEEYFAARQKARREQARYNPETNKFGFYYVWQDLTRDPYRFDQMKTDLPYKSRHLLTIP